MDPSPTSRPAVSSKTKWRLGLLLVVAAVMLLPTLFLVISHLAKPAAMQLAQPAKALAAPAGAPTEALTILVGRGRQPYYYFGTATPAAADSLHAATPAQPIGQVIRAWQQRRKANVFIKNGAESNYDVLVDLLDEMNSTNQRRYAVVPATAADRQLLASAQQ
jgi:biopolymer transport protein ExbD